MVALVHRCLQCTARILVNSYLELCARAAAHLARRAPRLCVRAHAQAAPGPGRFRPAGGDAGAHVRPGAAARAREPVRLPPGTAAARCSATCRSTAHWAKLTDVAPVHRMAKAVAIVPVGHDFPPFSANKGGTMDGSKLFLLTFDLAFQLQEQLRALEAGGHVPDYIAREPRRGRASSRCSSGCCGSGRSRRRASSTGLPSRARVVICAGLSGVWQYSRGVHAGVAQRRRAGLPPMSACQVINHTPAGYALRQADTSPGPAAHRRARSRCASRAEAACRSRWCVGSATR